MTKIGAYKILPDKQLIIEYYSGEITVKDLIFLKNVIRKEPNYNWGWNTILDFRDCVLLIKNADLKDLVDFFKNNFERSKTRTLVVLSASPTEVALSVLYSFLVKDSGLGFDTYTFSTTLGIVKLYGENIITEKGLEEIIDDLKSSPNNVYEQ